MIFTAMRGRDFSETFDFKNSQGDSLSAPAGAYKVIAERSGFIREFSPLRVNKTGVTWSMTADEVDSLPYSKLSFTLYYNGGEIARGILRVN